MFLIVHLCQIRNQISLFHNLLWLHRKGCKERLASQGTWGAAAKLALVSRLAAVTADSLSQAGLALVAQEQIPVVGMERFIFLL